MKPLKKVLLTGILTIVSICAMAVTSKATTVKITGDTLNIRKGPSTSEQIIAMVSKGVECELLEEQENWYKIKYKTYTGYISKQYAELINEPNNTTNNNQNTNEEQNQNNNENNQSNENQNDDNQTQNTIIYKKVTKNTDIKILPLIHSSKIGEIKKDSEVIIITRNTKLVIYSNQFN